MAVWRLRVENLRCLESVRLELDPTCNYIFGPNGSGKTSLLESLHVLGRARSFRTRQNRRLIRRGTPGFTVHAETRTASGQHRLGVGFIDGRLRVRIDGHDAAGSSALASYLAVHVIEPGIHALIEGGPGERRRFLDWGVFHVEHDYLDAWRRYRRVLGQRNAALKTAGAPLHGWDSALLDAAARVTAARRDYVASLQPLLDGYGKRLLDQPLRLRYRAGWADGESLESALTRSSAADRHAGSTRVGPHRADLVVGFEEGQVRDQSSRGQQKLVAAALILAQATLFERTHSGGAVLLVDDPAAELDGDALSRLLGAVADVPAQRILTGLSPAALEPLAAARVFHVEQGSIKEVYNIPV
jgi:DNA replication and repair protein RecF